MHSGHDIEFFCIVLFVMYIVIDIPFINRRIHRIICTFSKVHKVIVKREKTHKVITDLSYNARVSCIRVNPVCIQYFAKIEYNLFLHQLINS